MSGIIRVLTHDDPVFVEEHGRLIRQAYGIPSRSRCIADPGLALLRQTVTIPVISAAGLFISQLAPR